MTAAVERSVRTQDAVQCPSASERKPQGPLACCRGCHLRRIAASTITARQLRWIVGTQADFVVAAVAVAGGGAALWAVAVFRRPMGPEVAHALNL